MADTYQEGRARGAPLAGPIVPAQPTVPYPQVGPIPITHPARPANVHVSLVTARASQLRRPYRPRWPRRRWPCKRLLFASASANKLSDDIRYVLNPAHRVAGASHGTDGRRRTSLVDLGGGEGLGIGTIEGR